MQLFPWKGLVNSNAPGTVCFIPVVLSSGMLQGFSQEVWERLWLRKEQREWGHQLQKCVCIATTALQGNSKQAFLQKTKQAGKKVEFLGKWLGKGGSRSW